MKLLKSLENYFKNTPQEKLDNDWEKIKHLNKIGVDTLEYQRIWKGSKIVEKKLLK